MGQSTGLAKCGHRFQVGPVAAVGMCRTMPGRALQYFHGQPLGARIAQVLLQVGPVAEVGTSHLRVLRQSRIVRHLLARCRHSAHCRPGRPLATLRVDATRRRWLGPSVRPGASTRMAHVRPFASCCRGRKQNKKGHSPGWLRRCAQLGLASKLRNPCWRPMKG